MTKNLSVIRWGITANFFVFSLLVIVALAAILAIMLISFQRIDTLTTTMLDENLNRIITNSRSGQELTSLFADLVTAIFSNQSDSSSTTLQDLRTRLDALDIQDANANLQRVLQQFTQQLSTALAQTTLIKQHAIELTDLEDQFVFTLEMLEDLMSEKVEQAGENPLILNQLKQLQVMPIGYRSSFLQIIKEVSALEKTGDTEANGAQRIFTEIASLLSRLQLIVENKDSEIQKHGQELAIVLTSYKERILLLQQAQQTFQEQLTQARDSKEQALAMLSERDNESAQTAKTIRSSIRASIQASRRFVIALAGVIGSILLMLSYHTVRAIRPLATMAQVARQISLGNLTIHISKQASRNEIGVLNEAFREMQTQISEVVRDVKISAQDITQRSREMNAVAEEMSERATQQAAATEEVSAAMEEMAATIRQTTQNTQMTVEISTKSAEDARAGKQAVSDIIKAMEMISERIFLVQEIASQTNMLSLNASIEASKAQEYGKGFTVVASSVRELARQSRTAADEIRALVNSCLSLSLQAGEVLQRLVPNSEKTAELVMDINAASQEQAHGVDQVNQAIQQLDITTQRTAATAEEVASTAENLASQADALQQNIAFFTVPEQKIDQMAMAADPDLLATMRMLGDKGLNEQAVIALVKNMFATLNATLPASADKPNHAPTQERREPLKDPSDDHDQEFEHF